MMEWLYILSWWDSYPWIGLTEVICGGGRGFGPVCSTLSAGVCLQLGIPKSLLNDWMHIGFHRVNWNLLIEVKICDTLWITVLIDAIALFLWLSFFTMDPKNSKNAFKFSKGSSITSCILLFNPLWRNNTQCDVYLINTTCKFMYKKFIYLFIYKLFIYIKGALCSPAYLWWFCKCGINFNKECVSGIIAWLCVL